jgi:septal ring factor EnvC (AmiA/AmiB activator)
MKMNVVILLVAGIIAVASLCVAYSSCRSLTRAGDLATLRTELRQTQVQLGLVIDRTDALEKQVRALEESIAELQQEVRAPRVPQPRVPQPWVPQPKTPQPEVPQPPAPHLTPLDTK